MLLDWFVSMTKFLGSIALQVCSTIMSSKGISRIPVLVHLTLVNFADSLSKQSIQTN